jgi:hypothetical protein
MKYNILRYENIGKYFKSNKAFDATIKDLRESAKSKQLLQGRKWKNIDGIRYLGINTFGDLVFECNSETKKGKYKQNIRFYDLKERKPKTRDEVLAMMRESDVGVSCNDPSFLYWGGAYNATKDKYNIFVETRGLNEPHIETKTKFVLCKHLIAVLHAVPFYWNTIIADYKEYFDILDKQNEELVNEAEEDFTPDEIEEASESVEEVEEDEEDEEEN